MSEYIYRYEVHLHTCRCSYCGVSTACEMVDAAHNAGYSGVVFTNHFYRGNTCVDRFLRWEDFVREYADDYAEAKSYAKKYDLDVLFGIEENYHEGHEALIYGLSPEQVAAQPGLGHFDLPELSEYVRGCGGVIICAHPYRDRAYIPNPDIDPDMDHFDGLEIYNQFNNHARDAMAARYAAWNRVDMVISGGDVHNAVNFGRSGLAFPHRVRDNAELVRLLREKDYRLIIDGEIYDRKEAVALTRRMK